MRSAILVAVHRLVEIVVPLTAVERLLGHLRAVAGLREVPVEEPRRDALAEDVQHRRQADVDLAPLVIRRPVDRVRGDLGLVDRRHRLRLLRQLRPSPRELGRVEAGQVHHRDVDVPAVMTDLGDDRLGEALARVLRAAVRRLKRDAAEGESRADLHDGAAVAFGHPFQRGTRAPNHAVVRDLRRPPVLVRLDVEELRVDGGHRIVDPDVDRSQLVLGRSFDLVGVGDIRRKHERATAALLDFLRRRL